MNLGDYIALIFVILLLVVLGTHAYASAIAAPWVPTRKKDYTRIIKALGPAAFETIADLGAGGGGVMRAIARAFPQAKVVGYEISIPAWFIATWFNGVSGLGGRCEMQMKNFYSDDLSGYDAIYCFLTPMAMRKLKDTFKHTLKPGTKVVSYAFEIPGWEGEKIKERPSDVPIFIYVK